MEKQNVERKGRPRKLTDEERIKNKTKYTLDREWYCDICNTGRNYTLAGKHCHMNTIKHRMNVIAINIREENKINEINE